MAKVFLSAGHGGNDPGAVANGLYEKTINLNVLLACKEVLEQHNVKVICSRIKDENDPVAQEVKEANVSGADIAVSFHTNAGRGDGFEVYYFDSSSSGKKLASLCEKQIKILGQNSRGIKVGNHLQFVRKTKMPSVLVETFFIDNVKDKCFGDTLSKQTAIGVAYAKSILEYFGIPYKTKTKTVTYRVQVGAYNDKSNAESMKCKLQTEGFDAIIV